MCGIFGVMFHRGGELPADASLAETARLLHHRGPDAHGRFAEPGLGLVHTRLSLLDLSERSNQPFWDAEGRHCLVYNGEVYNFQELRAELQREGVVFRTTSDTEVVLEALVRWGPDVALPKLEGMFAFALYDRHERSLWLARDRFGIKPLFVYDTREVFVFSSEIGAMRPWVRFEPDLLSISAFLYGYAGPHRGHTFFAGIRHVDPGSMVHVRHGGGTSTAKRFFSITDLVDSDEQFRLRNTSDSKLVDLIDERLNTTIKSQLVADAPVATLCSGGLDSSLITAIAARHHDNLAIFHANVAGPLSESDAAFTLARHLKLDLQSVAVVDQDFVDRIPQVIRHYGHPFYPNPHAIPFLMVSELVNAHKVKAVLTGEGADECYLGYPWLSPDIRRLKSYRRWKSYAKIGFTNLLSRIRGDLGTSLDPLRYWGPTWEADVLPGGFGRDQLALVTALHNRFEVVAEARENRDVLLSRGPVAASALKSLDLLQYNLRTLLHRNDTMGMAASLEARFPFLDSEFVRLAVNMPARAKVRFSPSYLDSRHYCFEDKWLLRKVAERYLPRDVSHRPKLGFLVNAHERMVVDRELFHESFLAETFGLASTAMDILTSEARQRLLIRLLQIEVWGSMFMRGASEGAVSERLRKFVHVTAVGDTTGSPVRRATKPVYQT